MSGSSVMQRPVSDSATTRWTVSRWWAPVAGLVVVAAALSTTTLLAALGIWWKWLSSAASPLDSLANTFIVLTPEWLKEFAIARFGTHDKTALGVGMYASIAVLALILGLVARRHRRFAIALLAMLVVVTAVAILTRAHSTVFDLIPLLIGAAVGIALIRLLFGALGATRPAVAGDEPAASPTTGITPTEVTSKVGSTVGRRTFFRRIGLAGVATAAVGAVARTIPTGASAKASRGAVKLPVAGNRVVIPAGAEQRVPGQTPLISPNAGFYRIDTEFNPPELTTADWTLHIKGMVEHPTSIDYDQLTRRPQIERAITMTCVSNEVGGTLAGNAVWIGARIDDLLKEAKPLAGADCVLCTDVNGFTISAPLEALTDGRDAILAVGMNGEPLPIEHGFPVRMVVPGLYGYVSATKWIASMEVTTFAKVTAYWTQRGWSEHGPIKTASRIDTPGAFAQVPQGMVVVAGVAWAQHRGIKKVEVQVDDGPWEPAELSTPLSVDTWVQWKYPWDAKASGLKTLRVRATDGTGALQTQTRAGTIPNGASGWHSRQVTVG
ncbi:MAG: molybdopterin-dependent oxidoreductase [Actinomycetota bacterium]|nr:molybdopterin-dependent oxidoreductase [Actinomycetota bacterium]